MTSPSGPWLPSCASGASPSRTTQLGASFAAKDLQVKRTLIAAGAHLLVLLLDSSDLNPVERALAKAQVAVATADKRTRGAAWCALGLLRPLFKPDQCTADLRNAATAALCRRLCSSDQLSA